MRLDDINAFIDVQRACARLASRIDGISYDTDLYFRSSAAFTEAARMTDRGIVREPFGGDGSYKLSFMYRGVEFWYVGKDAEVA